MGNRNPVIPQAPALPINGTLATSADAHDTVVGSAYGPAMDNLQHSQQPADSPDPVRRALLTSLLAASAASVIPSAFAAPAADAAQDAFVSASKILTGRTSLDPEQASLLYSALIADDPQFAAGVQALATILDQRKIDPLQLQHVLDNEHSALAALPRKIVTAWYLGVVGDGEKARCITFETNLTNVIVSDKLKPPSYCHGGYGSWAEKP
jgi:hypothetical protein